MSWGRCSECCASPATAGPGVPSEPTPSLSRLDALVRSLSGAGLCVDSVSSGLPRALPAAVNLTAYRLVQESLTNAHKHGGDRAQVTLAFHPQQLAVEVCNGPPPGVAQPTAAARTGHGLLGMRERVLSVGGWLEAGPTPEGGFRVCALLPAVRDGPGGAAVTIRVLIADDQALIRAGFRALVDSAPDLEVVGEASDGRRAVELARNARADVVLMDVRMPDLDGLAATRLICGDENLAGVRVLILTTFELDEYVFEALRAGASGFLGKGVEPGELLDAIRTVAVGDALLSPKATKGLIARFLTAPETSPGTSPRQLEVLTAREREVLALVATGLSNGEIADHLVVSPLTAKTHINRAMMKLGARDRAQLVVVAYQTGLVRAAEPPSQ